MGIRGIRDTVRSGEIGYNHIPLMIAQLVFGLTGPRETRGDANGGKQVPDRPETYVPRNFIAKSRTGNTREGDRARAAPPTPEQDVGSVPFSGPRRFYLGVGWGGPSGAEWHFE